LQITTPDDKIFIPINLFFQYGQELYAAKKIIGLA